MHAWVGGCTNGWVSRWVKGMHERMDDGWVGGWKAYKE